MNSPRGSDSEGRLDSALRAWKVEAPLPASFEARVWDRIERGEATRQSASPAGPFQTFLGFLARPAFASVCLVILLAGGAVAGAATARVASRRIDAQLGARYVQSLAPFRGDAATP